METTIQCPIYEGSNLSCYNNRMFVVEREIILLRSNWDSSKHWSIQKAPVVYNFRWQSILFPIKGDLILLKTIPFCNGQVFIYKNHVGKLENLDFSNQQGIETTFLQKKQTTFYFVIFDQ